MNTKSSYINRYSKPLNGDSNQKPPALLSLEYGGIRPFKRRGIGLIIKANGFSTLIISIGISIALLISKRGMAGSSGSPLQSH